MARGVFRADQGREDHPAHVDRGYAARARFAGDTAVTRKDRKGAIVPPDADIARPRIPTYSQARKLDASYRLLNTT